MPMPMMQKSALLLIFLFSSNALFAYAIIITPDAFNRMIETSSGILDEYYEYSKEIENQKYRFVFDETLLGTPNKDFVVPTTLGNRNMEIGEYNGCFSLSFKIGIWQLGCFAISNAFAIANNYLTDSSNQVFS